MPKCVVPGYYTIIYVIVGNTALIRLANLVKSYSTNHTSYIISFYIVLMFKENKDLRYVAEANEVEKLVHFAQIKWMQWSHTSMPLCSTHF